MLENSSSSNVNLNQTVLVNVLCKRAGGFNVVHFNARSLNSDKLDSIRNIFEDSFVDVLCVSETWFCADIPDYCYSIPNYNLFRNDRVGRRGGGVAVYCRNNLNVNIISSSTSEIEFMTAVISDASTKVLVSCVYNPSKNTPLQPFSMTLHLVFLTMTTILYVAILTLIYSHLTLYPGIFRLCRISWHVCCQYLYAYKIFTQCSS